MPAVASKDIQREAAVEGLASWYRLTFVLGYAIVSSIEAPTDERRAWPALSGSV